jgi:hypothetical protein
MALYNCLDRSAVEGLTRRFGIGDITDISVIDGGHENTSYCVETSSGRYVLTICDQQSLKAAASAYVRYYDSWKLRQDLKKDQYGERTTQ